MKIVLLGWIGKIEEKLRRRHISGVKEHAVFEDVSEGWFMMVGNASIYAGQERPPFKAGDRIKITMEKV